ncbi:MAG: MFS transporter, partial [Cyanobacteria bacterium J06632_3]
SAALLLNLVGTTLSYLILGSATSLWMLFISRLLAGLSSASVVIAQAYVTDLTPPEQRARLLSLIEAAVGIGFIFGPVVGTLLLGSDPNRPNFQRPGMVAAIASLLTLLITFFSLPRLQSSRLKIRRPPASNRAAERPPSSLSSIMQMAQSVNKTFQRPLVGPIMVWVFITMFVSVGVQVIFPLWCAERFGWGAKQYGYLVVIFSVLTATAQICLTGRLVNKFGERNLALLSIISAALGVFLMSLSTTVLQFSGAVIFSIFAQATCAPALTSLVSQLAGAKQQGKTLGLMQSVSALAGFAGAIWVGFVFDAFGENWPLWINGGLLVISVAWGWRQVSSMRLFTVIEQHRQHKLDYLFNILDQDGNGAIELIDFQQAGQRLAAVNQWLAGSAEYAAVHRSFTDFGQALQHLVDGDCDGKISRTDWQQFFQRNAMESGDRTFYNTFTRKFLNLIDTSQNGRISTEDLRRFYQAYSIPTDDIEAVFHNLDFDQYGYLSKAKFSEQLIQFICSHDIQAAGTWLFGSRLPKQL